MDSDFQTITIGTAVVKYVDYYGTPYFSAPDIFTFVGNINYQHRVKDTLKAGIDYFQMKVRGVMPYFITPKGLVEIIDRLSLKNYDNVGTLYRFFQEKYNTECTIPTNIERKCVICGARIPITAPWQQIYCSKKCKCVAVRNKAREKERLDQLKRQEVKCCAHCGKEFQTTNPRQIFCSATCRINYTHAHRVSNYSLDEKVCPICGNTFMPVTTRHTTCSIDCKKKWLELRRQNKRICKHCNSIFQAENSKQDFCSRDCEVAYYQKRNYYDVKKAYPEEYSYYKKKILPKMRDFLGEDPSPEELRKPDYQRKNSILVSFDPYPV